MDSMLFNDHLTVPDFFDIILQLNVFPAAEQENVILEIWWICFFGILKAPDGDWRSLWGLGLEVGGPVS